MIQSVVLVKFDGAVGFAEVRIGEAEVAQRGTLMRSVADFSRGLRVRFRACLRVTKLSQHETDGGKFQEREGVAVEIFPILGEAAATVEPRNGAFDGPTLG